MDPLSYDLGKEHKYCSYAGKAYEAGKNFQINECTQCKCEEDVLGDDRFGGASCEITDCPEVNCPRDKTVKIQGRCCLVCLEEYLVEIDNCPVHPIKMTLDHDKDFVYFKFQPEMVVNIPMNLISDVKIDPKGYIFPWIGNDKAYVINVDAAIRSVDGISNFHSSCTLELFVIGEHEVYLYFKSDITRKNIFSN